MAKNKKFNVKFKRRIQHKTNYHKRLKLVKSRNIRLIIRPTLNNIIVQFSEYSDNGDKVILTTSSKKLINFGWKANRGNIPTAYLTGLLGGLDAKKRRINKAILDIGIYRSVKGSRIYSALKGVIDAGLEIPHDSNIFPNEAQISGESISNYAKLIQENKSLYDRQFGRYIRNSISPIDLKNHFQSIKSKILELKND